jgi:CubicO group peptidase (beta-lactamase class C family)
MGHGPSLLQQPYSDYLKPISMLQQRKKVRLLLVSLPLVFLFMAAKKQLHRSEPASTVADIDKIVLDEMAECYYIGCAVAVVKDGRIIHQKGYGHLNELRTQPVTTSTVFRWASISKTLTAAAAWRLIENNKLTLNTTAASVVPYWPTAGNKDNITVAQLMQHRSGINHYTNYDKGKYLSWAFFNAEQSVNVFKSAPLDFTPGTQNQYTTFGYNLLGAVVDKASVNGYLTYITNNILVPNGLTSISWLAGGHEGYELTCEGGLKRQTEGNTVWKLPGGGWSSNIVDLAKYMQALMENKILTNTSQMWQPVPNNSSYCYGLKNETVGGETRVSHGGANDEISTEMAFYPSSGLGVVVMINGDAYCDAENLAKRIEKFYGKRVSPDENGNKNILCGTGASCNGSGNDRLIGVWRPDAGETIWRRRMGQDQFAAEWKWLDAEPGYDLIDIETYLVDGVRYWDGIFKKQNKGTALWRNFSQEAFHDKWVEMSNNGYRLIDVETYEDNGNRLWAGVFEAGSGKYALFRNYGTNDFINKHHDLQNDGQQLIDIEVFKDDDGNLKWSGVWREGAASRFFQGKTISEFNTLIKEQANEGYRLKDVETWLEGSARKWAGVFDAYPKACAFQNDRSYCQLATDDSGFSPQHLMDMEIYK